LEKFFIWLSDYLLRDWTLIQLAVIAGTVGLAVLVGRIVEPRLEAKIRSIHGKPRQLRFLAMVLRRTNWIVIALGLWVAVYAMRASIWPSRSYLVGRPAGRPAGLLGCVQGSGHQYTVPAPRDHHAKPCRRSDA